MSWTKKEFIIKAFEQIGFGSYVYDLEPEQFQSALSSLDSMMAGWNARGIRVGYPLVNSPNASNLDDDTSVPDAAFEAIYSNLAIRIAPNFGKQIQQETRFIAKQSYDFLVGKLAMPNEMQFDAHTPSGAGNNRFGFRRDFLQSNSEDLQAGNDTNISI
jgi:hypothetical protein